MGNHKHLDERDPIDETETIKEQLAKLSFKDYRNISLDFGKQREELKNISSHLEKDLRNILHISILPDKELTEKEKQQLPLELQRFLNYAEHREINYYLLLQGEEIYGVYIGLFGGTSGRTNDFFFKELLENPAITAKVKKLSSNYQLLLKNL